MTFYIISCVSIYKISISVELRFQFLTFIGGVFNLRVTRLNFFTFEGYTYEQIRVKFQNVFPMPWA